MVPSPVRLTTTTAATTMSATTTSAARLPITHGIGPPACFGGLPYPPGPGSGGPPHEGCWAYWVGACPNGDGEGAPYCGCEGAPYGEGAGALKGGGALNCGCDWG